MREKTIFICEKFSLILKLKVYKFNLPEIQNEFLYRIKLLYVVGYRRKILIIRDIELWDKYDSYRARKLFTLFKHSNRL